jgi:hypothetical protein
MATVCFGGHMDPRRLLLESTRRPAGDPCTWLEAVEALVLSHTTRDLYVHLVEVRSNTHHKISPTFYKEQ